MKGYWDLWGAARVGLRVVRLKAWSRGSRIHGPGVEG